ncbi:MAG: stage 0 sporulation protein [Syntrophobacterales bacterium]|nr:stage 0 sporulation protein [Syntrophobacterales bacterium]
MDLIKVRLNGGSHCCSLATGAEDLQRGDWVVVALEDGPELGRVETIYRHLELQRVPENLKTLLRRATPADLEQADKNRALAARAFAFCQDRILARQLPIHLVRAHVLFDGSKIIFYFTAPGRVDFRELVKDLVQEFRNRIELRQIGVRHRAKMVGGLGVCGQKLCCASFIRDFEPVSVRMAKEQQLSLNPNKISGVCGRLMCCLTYEYAAYQEIRRHLPRVGKRVHLPDGDAKIIRYNIIRQTVTLETASGEERELPLEELPLAPLPAAAGASEPDESPPGSEP